MNADTTSLPNIPPHAVRFPMTELASCRRARSRTAQPRSPRHRVNGSCAGRYVADAGRPSTDVCPRRDGDRAVRVLSWTCGRTRPADARRSRAESVHPNVIGDRSGKPLHRRSLLCASRVRGVEHEVITNVSKRVLGACAGVLLAYALSPDAFAHPDEGSGAAAGPTAPRRNRANTDSQRFRIACTGARHRGDASATPPSSPHSPADGGVRSAARQLRSTTSPHCRWRKLRPRSSRSTTRAPAESASSVHLDRDELRYRSRTQVSDILRQVPGLVVSQHAGGGKSDQYFIRGFDADHGTDIAIFADGIPVNLHAPRSRPGLCGHALDDPGDDRVRRHAQGSVRGAVRRLLHGRRAGAEDDRQRRRARRSGSRAARRSPDHDASSTTIARLVGHGEPAPPRRTRATSRCIACRSPSNDGPFVNAAGLPAGQRAREVARRGRAAAS